MKIEKKTLYVSLATLGVAVLAGWFVQRYSAANASFVPVVDPDQGMFWNRLYYLFAVAVFVERSVEVYLGIAGLNGKYHTAEDGTRIKIRDATGPAAAASIVIGLLLALSGLRILDSLVILVQPGGDPMLPLRQAIQTVQDAIPVGDISFGNINTLLARAADIANSVNLPTSDDKVLQVLFAGIDVIISAGLIAGGSKILHPLAESLTEVCSGLSERSKNWRNESDSSRSREIAPVMQPRAQAERELSIAELNLAEPALTGARLLKTRHPEVVFVSGRTDALAEARRMAGNVENDRSFLMSNCRPSEARDELQSWLGANTSATSSEQIEAGFFALIDGWPVEKKMQISRHIVGLAFDVEPISGSYGDTVKQTIENLPKLNVFLTKEGNLTRWCAQFDQN